MTDCMKVITSAKSRMKSVAVLTVWLQSCAVLISIYLLLLFKGVSFVVKVQNPGDDACDLFDASRGPLSLRHDVSQQNTRRRRYSVIARVTVSSCSSGLISFHHCHHFVWLLVDLFCLVVFVNTDEALARQIEVCLSG